MNSSTICSRCGSSLLEPGIISGFAYFRPDNVGSTKLQSSDLQIRATICLDCGEIELKGDTDRVHELLGVHARHPNLSTADKSRTPLMSSGRV